MKITDFKISFNNMESAVNASKMFELQKQISLSVLSGQYKNARKFQKELAQTAVKDFETFKALPFMHYHFPPVMIKSFLGMLFNNFKFKIFQKFVKFTPEEKQFKKMRKEFYENLSQEEIKAKTIDVTIPSLF